MSLTQPQLPACCVARLSTINEHDSNTSGPLMSYLRGEVFQSKRSGERGSHSGKVRSKNVRLDNQA